LFVLIFSSSQSQVTAVDPSAPEEVKLFAKDSLSLLLRANAMDVDRSFFPTQGFEMERIKVHAPIFITVSFPEGNQKELSLSIDSISTIGEAINMVADKLEIVDASQYTLCNSIRGTDHSYRSFDNLCMLEAYIIQKESFNPYWITQEESFPTDTGLSFQWRAQNSRTFPWGIQVECGFKHEVIENNQPAPARGWEYWNKFVPPGTHYGH
jgi:hypothetical protein